MFQIDARIFSESYLQDCRPHLRFRRKCQMTASLMMFPVPRNQLKHREAIRFQSVGSNKGNKLNCCICQKRKIKVLNSFLESRIKNIFSSEMLTLEIKELLDFKNKPMLML